MDGNVQQVTETIGVIVKFDATADRRGQRAVSQVERDEIRAVRRAAGWQIDRNAARAGFITLAASC